MTKKEIAKLSYRLFEKLWDSGLGKDYCKENQHNFYVSKILSEANYYHRNGFVQIFWASLCLLTALFSVVIIFAFPGFFFQSIKSPFLITLGLLIIFVQLIIKSIKNFQSSRKVKMYDLSGFDIEGYSPTRRNLKMNSIEWGFKTGRIIKDGNELFYNKKDIFNSPNFLKN